ncbi:ENO [Mytilus coruscus]|uniref:ENO n=1 Tax=Mytilus coruscus TaxID=42192 RepID=A0A6J8BIX8_MYTCO|nr:ENO [Mytilus coruscus]
MLVTKKQTGHAGIPILPMRLQNKNFNCMQEFSRSIKQELSHAGNKLAMQEFMILPTGMYRSINKNLVMLKTNWPCRNSLILPTGMYRSIKQELQSCWKQTGHAGIHDSTNWYRSINKDFSHAGNKLAMQEFMILPTGMYRSIKQELSHAGNKLAMQEFMILPTGNIGL